MNKHIFDDNHYCMYCGSNKAETLTTHCPRQFIGPKEQLQIAAGKVDYRFGTWIGDSAYIKPDKRKGTIILYKVTLTRLQASRVINLLEYKFYTERLKQYEQVDTYNP